MNYLIVALTALIPLVVGFIWYNPSVFGKTWMRASGMRPEDAGRGNMALVFILTYVFSLMVSMFLMGAVIHQAHIYSIFANEPSVKDPNSELGKYMADFMSRFGHNFRTFKHGAFHGTLVALFFGLPIISILAMFERKRFNYIAVHTGYWIVCLALMGGVICQFIKL